MNSMDIRDVLECLPHRYPLLLVDRVISCELGKKIVALKNVTFNEPFFNGHFPRNPIMPGVLIIEALAQASALLSFRTMNHKANDQSVYLFVGINHARFKRPVIPGDALMLEAELKKNARNMWIFDAVAKVNDVVVTEAEIMCTIRTYEETRAGS